MSELSSVFRLLVSLLAFFVIAAESYDEVLFDMSKVKNELKWEQIALNQENDEVAWSEETWRNPNAVDEIHANQRAYVTCNYEMVNPDNWLFMTPLPVKHAKRIFFEVLFNTRDCNEALDPKSCKETFAIYSKEYKTQKSAMENVTRSIVANRKSWKNIARLARSMKNVTKETISMVVEPGTKFVRFGFNEQGICLSLLNIRVYYRVCESFTHGLVRFEEHVAGGKEAEILNINGSCIENASKKIQAVPLAGICMANGNAIKTSGECQCDGGYLEVADSEGIRCEGCPPHLYRPLGAVGDSCLPCPANSFATGSASSCRCNNGFFRAEDELVSAPCTQQPSRPIKVTASGLSSSSVRLSWEEPSSLGGRPEIWYEVKCRGDCGTVVMSPKSEMLAARYIQINNLRPLTEYTFLIFARNKVSKQAIEEKHAVIDIRTKSKEEDEPPVSNLRVDAAQSDGLTISWSVIDSNLNDFEVEVRPAIAKKRAFETKHVNATYTTFIGLREDTVYSFRVKVRDDLRWSESISYQLGKGVISVNSADEEIGESAFLNQAGSALLLVIAGILVVIAIALCMIVVQKRTKNRKQMSDLDVLDTYKQDSMTPDYHTASRHHHHLHNNSTNLPSNLHEQLRSATKLNAPLIPSFGSPISQPPPYYGGVHTNSGKYKAYVDPTTYEDPYQALVEFTYDIDPHDVFITQVIGGGEFGDVCLGGLSKNNPAAGKSTGTMSRLFESEQYETVAIKTLKAGSSPKSKAEFLTEATIMGQFSHPNVIRLIGVVTATEPVMIVTEYMSNGSLDQLLRNKDQRGEKFQWEKITEMLYGIASGMKYLTDMGYVHRDLAARNVLVDSELRCKIADFGLSRGIRTESGSIEAEYTTNGGKIPVRWTAPEAITHRKFTPSSDVWSFGVVIWEVCSYGERPYWDWTNQKVISEVMIGYRLPPPLDCPMGLYRIAEWCWRMERHERPTFSQLLGTFHKFILQPHLIQYDGGELTRRTKSVGNLNTYGAITVPNPPSSAPPLPNLDEFLISIGLNHVYGQLMSNNINTVSDLAQTSHLDLLACGLISQECSTIRDALNNRVAQSTVHHTIRGTKTFNPKSSRDEGFFV